MHAFLHYLIGFYPCFIQRCEDDDGYTNESVMALMMAERGAPLHDLSTWRVTIPAIASKPELDNPRKNYYSYVLDVNRLDVVEGK